LAELAKAQGSYSLMATAEQGRDTRATRQAEQQQLREEAAARQAERDAVEAKAAIDEYTARNCPCCHGEGPENLSSKQQELIDFIKTDGIQCQFDDDGNQIAHSFHPQELFNELFCRVYSTNGISKLEVPIAKVVCGASREARSFFPV